MTLTCICFPGFRIIFYILELNFCGVYTMLELCNLDVAHAFELVRSTSLHCSKEFQDNKTKSMSFEDLECLVFKRRDPFSLLLITLLSDVHHLCVVLCYYPATSLFKIVYGLYENGTLIPYLKVKLW